MSFGISLTVLDLPLDVPALEAFISGLPGAHRRDDGVWSLARDGCRVQIALPHVSVAFRVQDNRQGHGTAVGLWVLDRHECAGQDLDYGTRLADNGACRAHLLRASGCPEPASPERLQAVLSPLLVGCVMHSIEATREDLVARFARVGEDRVHSRLRLSADAAAADGDRLPEEDLDEQLLRVLYQTLSDPIPVTGVTVGWAAPLVLSRADDVMRFSAAPDAAVGERIWTVEDGEGRPVVASVVGEGPLLLLRGG